ncbi:MAG: hypothetical protein QOI49_1934 [Verrucomicrobiota bacterium]|jgi:hypothetical protein
MTKPFFQPARWVKQISWPVLFFATASALVFIGPWTWFPKPFTLVLPLRTARAVQLKLYYTGGSEFREDWTSVRYAESRSGFKVYRLPIDTTNLKKLRLHVGPAVVLDLGQVTLARLAGPSVPIAPSEVKVGPAPCGIEQHGDFIRLSTSPDSEGFDLELYNSNVPLISGRHLEQITLGLLCVSLLGLLWTVARQRRALVGEVHAAPRTSRISARACAAIVLGLTLIFFINVLLNLNGSSSAIWRFCMDGRLPERGLLLGTAKDIRSDEWMVQTPWMLSQASADPPFQTSNPNVGDGATGLLVNLPIRHWTTFFRPQFWGFFFLDFQHAFSWYWNLKWYVLVVGSFLFFRITSRGHLLATITGTVLVFFAPYMQWWYSTGAALPEIVGLAFLGVWAFHFLRRAKRPLGIALAALTLLVAVENFIFCCYPRFQIPLLYFAVLGAIWVSFTARTRPAYRLVRYACLATVLGLIFLCAFVWYGEVAPTLRMTALLEYPGKVFSTGGDFSWSRFFLPFLQFGTSEFHFPAGLVNASNAAGFVLLLPFVVLLMASRPRAWRDGFVLLMICFVAAVGYFMMVGIPPALAKYSGWSLVYSTRGILPAGIGLIACFVRVLARPSSRREMTPLFGAIVFVALAAAWWLCLSVVNEKYEEFVSAGTVIAVAAYLAVISILFTGRTQMLATTLLLAPIVAATAFVNPLGRGLPGIYDSETFGKLRSFAAKDHIGRWLVIGRDRRSSYVPYVIKAAGGDVLSGIRCNPDMRMFEVLDPERKHFDVWNRFAVVTCARSPDDQVGLTLTSAVSYTVTLPFRTDLLDRLGIKYILSVDTPREENQIPGFRAVAMAEGLVLNVRQP